MHRYKSILLPSFRFVGSRSSSPRALRWQDRYYHWIIRNWSLSLLVGLHSLLYLSCFGRIRENWLPIRMIRKESLFHVIGFIDIIFPANMVVYSDLRVIHLWRICLLSWQLKRTLQIIQYALIICKVLSSFIVVSFIGFSAETAVWRMGKCFQEDYITSSHTRISIPLYTTTILCSWVWPMARFTVSVSA